MFSTNLMSSFIDKVTARDTKFSTSYSRFSISCLRCIRNLSRWISILINSHCRCSINLSNYAIFHHNKSSSISRLTWVDLEISKNYSDILMGQQLLCLLYYYQLVFYLLFLSYAKKIYLMLSCCYSSYD